MSLHATLWIAFNAFVLAMLALDLWLAHRHQEAPSTKATLAWTGVWVGVSLAIFGGIWAFWSTEKALQFITGYVIEYALSVDNLFVFVLIFGYFKIAPRWQHKMLFWGILGAFVMRASLIIAGAALVQRFHWLFYFFGAFLLFSAVRLVFGGAEEDAHPEQSRILRWAAKLLPVTHDAPEGSFSVKRAGKRFVTPLLLVLILVEATDLLFALDSIPAVLGVSSDRFILYSSNVCAILGLRTLFFLVASLMEKLRFLNVALAVVLGFIGLKMLVHTWVEIPILISLSVIAGVLATAVLASLLVPERSGREARVRALVLEKTGGPLRLDDRPALRPGPGELVLKVEACAVCRTDLHVLDGELPDAKRPLVLGHEVVGRVERVGEGVARKIGERVGVPWLAWADGTCEQCRAGRENLCPNARFTGYQVDGGYAEEALAHADFVIPLPAHEPADQLAPLLCAGAIGYRSLRFAGEGRRVGLYGFGAAAHILAQVLRHQGREAYAFSRPGDAQAQAFARSLGAVWAGGSDQAPPELLDAAILFAPVGALVPLALAAVKPGGVVVCGGIHMSDLPSFPYSLLWGERTVRSVANLTRADARELLAIAPEVPIRTSIRRYPLEAANEALADLRAGRLEGAAVLVP